VAERKKYSSTFDSKASNSNQIASWRLSLPLVITIKPNPDMRPLYLTTLLLFMTYGATAQEKKPLFTETFENTRLPVFFQQLEAASPYFFYYDSVQLDSFRITLSVQNQPLQAVLEKAFAGTDVLFSIDAEQHVFVSRQLQVLTTLPAGFGDVPQKGKEVAQKAVAVVGDERRQAVKTTSENKLYEIGVKSANGKNTALLTGYIRNNKTGEPVVGASVSAEGESTGVLTDQYGFYSITLPQGSRSLVVQGLGMKDARYRLLVNGDGTLDIELAERVVSLKEVIVSTQKVLNVTRVQMGVDG
jgi:hypothetical protein